MPIAIGRASSSVILVVELCQALKNTRPSSLSLSGNGKLGRGSRIDSLSQKPCVVRLK